MKNYEITMGEIELRIEQIERDDPAMAGELASLIDKLREEINNEIGG